MAIFLVRIIALLYISVFNVFMTFDLLQFSTR